MAASDETIRMLIKNIGLDGSVQFLVVFLAPHGPAVPGYIKKKREKKKKKRKKVWKLQLLYKSSKSSKGEDSFNKELGLFYGCLGFTGSTQA